MRKSKPRTETRASQSRELGELSALARETVERKQKLPPDLLNVSVLACQHSGGSFCLFTGAIMKEIVHDSDCAVNNEPAFPAGPCDCGAEARAQRRYVRMMGQIFYKKAARCKNALRLKLVR